MKKVLAIAPYSYLPYSSGGQKFIALFFEYLGKEVALTVISVRENDFTLSKNYRTIPLLKKSFPIACFCLSISLHCTLSLGYSLVSIPNGTSMHFCCGTSHSFTAKFLSSGVIKKI